ncbi:hypothetical protein L596_009954 [Steinernema carpocapsae]|uniref:Uncharacterized protein n=1 Tax=Steinernema carpocapsae TaxID=34508 RepID=A0A4U5PGU5_STECR|nr:hypothetical protein L596_009954 [Steinernema carpocapsae]
MLPQVLDRPTHVSPHVLPSNEVTIEDKPEVTQDVATINLSDSLAEPQNQSQVTQDNEAINPFDKIPDSTPTITEETPKPQPQIVPPTAVLPTAKDCLKTLKPILILSVLAYLGTCLMLLEERGVCLIILSGVYYYGFLYGAIKRQTDNAQAVGNFVIFQVFMSLVYTFASFYGVLSVGRKAEFLSWSTLYAGVYSAAGYQFYQYYKDLKEEERKNRVADVSIENPYKAIFPNYPNKYQVLSYRDIASPAFLASLFIVNLIFFSFESCFISHMILIYGNFNFAIYVPVHFGYKLDHKKLLTGSLAMSTILFGFLLIFAPASIAYRQMSIVNVFLILISKLLGVAIVFFGYFFYRYYLYLDFEEITAKGFFENNIQAAASNSSVVTKNVDMGSAIRKEPEKMVRPIELV